MSNTEEHRLIFPRAPNDTVSLGRRMTESLARNMVESLVTFNQLKQIARHAIAEDAIGEGIPRTAGVLADLIHGTGDTLYEAARYQNWITPLHRLVGAQDNSHTQQWGEWGKETLGKPLANALGAGNVVYQQKDGGGALDYEVSFQNGEEGTFRDATGLEKTTNITAAILGDPFNLLGIGLASKTVQAWKLSDKMLAVYNITDATTFSLDTGAPLTEVTFIAPQDRNALIDQINTTDPYNIGDKRALEYRLNKVFSTEVDQHYKPDGSGKYQSIQREGDLNDPNIPYAVFETSVDILNVPEISGKENHITLRTQINALQLEKRVLDIAQRYIDSPEAFKLTSSEVLPVQFYLGKYALAPDRLGIESLEETETLFKKHIKDDYYFGADNSIVAAQFKISAETEAREEMIREKDRTTIAAHTTPLIL